MMLRVIFPEQRNKLEAGVVRLQALANENRNEKGGGSVWREDQVQRKRSSTLSQRSVPLYNYFATTVKVE